MKNTIVALALLMTSALAHAEAVRSDYADPNNKYSSMATVKPTCWKQHAVDKDTTQGRQVLPNYVAPAKDRFSPASALSTT